MTSFSLASLSWLDTDKWCDVNDGKNDMKALGLLLLEIVDVDL